MVRQGLTLPQVVEATGLADYFSALLSVEAVRTYKPDPLVYTLPERALNRGREELLFVSSNFWDVAGAHAFGLRVCWINRAGLHPEELGEQPDHVLASMAALPSLAGQ